MIIKATIRLQRYKTPISHRSREGGMRAVFVSKGESCHGIAKGNITTHVVEGASWASIRRTLRVFCVARYSNVGPTTVDSFTLDIGTAQNRLSPSIGLGD